MKEDNTQQPIESKTAAQEDAELDAYIESLKEHTDQTERAKEILAYALGLRTAAICLVDGLQEVIATQNEEREDAIKASMFALRSLKANYRLLDLTITGA